MKKLVAFISIMALGLGFSVQAVEKRLEQAIEQREQQIGPKSIENIIIIDPSVGAEMAGLIGIAGIVGFSSLGLTGLFDLSWGLGSTLFNPGSNNSELLARGTIKIGITSFMAALSYKILDDACRTNKTNLKARI